MLKPTHHFALLCMLASGPIFAQEPPAAATEAPASAPEAAMDLRKATVVNAQYQQQALSDEQKTDEVVWLEPTYPDQSQPARVLALAQKHRTAQAQGAVLIVPDQGQHADWPNLVAPLRQSLPDHGWYTLSITMPNPSPGTVPSRQLGTKALDSIGLNEQIQSALQGGARAQKPEAATTPQAAPATPPTEPQTPAQPADPAAKPSVSDPVDIDLQGKMYGTEQPGSFSVWAQANLQAGMAYLQGLGYQNIVLIALGRNAEAALTWLKPNAQQMSQGGFALILLDPQFTSMGQSFWQDRLGAEFTAPVLDIVNSADLDARDASELRRSGAFAAGMRGYQQSRLQTAGDGVAQKNLLRRIQQWLDIHAPGMAATQFKRPPR